MSQFGFVRQNRTATKYAYLADEGIVNLVYVVTVSLLIIKQNHEWHLKPFFKPSAVK